MQEVRKLLCDEQWEKLSPLLPGKPSDPGATAQDNRLFLEAVLWIMRTGSPWRDLPAELGNWHTTYTRFKRWGESGVWQPVRQIITRDRDLKMLMIDSTVVRAHQHAAGAKKKRGHRQKAVRVVDGRVKFTSLSMRSVAQCVGCSLVASSRYYTSQVAVGWLENGCGTG